MTRGLKKCEMGADSSPLLALPALLHNIPNILSFQGSGTNISRANPDLAVCAVYLCDHSKIKSHKCKSGNFVNSSSTNFFYRK